MKKIDALSINPKVGKEMLSAAIEMIQRESSDNVVKEVRAVIERKELMERFIQKSKRRLALCDSQLQAINDGKFKIVNTGSYTRGEKMVKYNDDELNVDWSHTENW